ncbi:MAG: hypothetical protein QOD77_1080 [Thermoplasmata archaeon]|jgi:hypothetical protein|nr:hypothetical protein [Thermoplasmata archaeon]
MGTLTLLAVGAVHLLTAASFVAVGERLRRRDVSPTLRGANIAFVLWWWAMAAYLATEGAFAIAGSTGWTSLPAYLAARYASGPLLSFAAACLAYHILFVYFGTRHLLLPLAMYYEAAAIGYAYSVHVHGPIAVRATDWGLVLDYADPVQGPLWTAVLASIGLPLVVGGVAYVSLAPRVDRAQRYRVLLVGLSLLIWVVGGFAGQVAGSALTKFLTIVGLGLLTSGTVLLAYFPPKWVARWLAAAPSPSG